ncbi:MAG: lipid II flippase Amj family protein [Candidatus Margulisbacteria bacterium]|nr:lipid II flippase Amj family protein [Candidatus Margulisiibacteriota bacterium]MBU1617475.1 lipid II flippase Amj family protein [Candidatus Margulisiibacteriota bacterium]
MNPLYIVCILTGIIHFTETAASSLRLAGVRTGQIATSLSFVNATLLVTRTSNMLQAPFLGGLVDHAIMTGNPSGLVGSFRMVIFAAFIGNLLGAVCTPFFVAVFTKAILRFERVGSVPRLIVAAFFPRNLTKIIDRFRLPAKESLMNLSLKGMPKGFLWTNLIVVSVYAIGVLSSLYAGALVPEFRITASQLSAIVNGIATILLVTLVDPTCAYITDQAVKGKRREGDVRAMVFYIIMGRVVGTLVLSQLLFLPSAEYIKSATLMVKGMFGQ